MIEGLLQLDSVTKTYTTGAVTLTALGGVSLTVGAGEFIAVMGPSGSGKSTLMNILGLLDRPSSGRFIFEGEDISRHSDRRLARLRREKLGFIFQSFNLFPRYDALRNVSMPLAYAGVPSRERKQRALAMLERVGLADRSRHRPKELSGGQQQRVAIARALVNQPSIVLGDEPTGNLDSRTGESILALLQELNDTGVTLILVTHDEAVARHAKRVVRLLDGAIVSDDAVAAPARAATQGELR